MREVCMLKPSSFERVEPKTGHPASQKDVVVRATWDHTVIPPPAGRAGVTGSAELSVD